MKYKREEQKDKQGGANTRSRTVITSSYNYKPEFIFPENPTWLVSSALPVYTPYNQAFSGCQMDTKF